MPASQRTPLLFVSHGAPTEALEEGPWAEALREFGVRHPGPKAVAVVSAHWETRAPIRVTAVESPSTIHDFSGFPPELYEIEYPAPGAPALANEIVERLSKAHLPAVLDERRGLDHGVWVPLRFIFPGADVPVVAVSLPVPRTPETVLEAGGALAPLRENGVLLMGSGGVVHNLSRVSFATPQAEPDPWAREFDRWVWEKLERGDLASLLTYRSLAPSADLAVPTSEHFDPLFFVLGGRSDGERAVSLHAGIEYANLSMRCVAFE